MRSLTALNIVVCQSKVALPTTCAHLFAIDPNLGIVLRCNSNYREVWNKIYKMLSNLIITHLNCCGVLVIHILNNLNLVLTATCSNILLKWIGTSTAAIYIDLSTCEHLAVTNNLDITKCRVELNINSLRTCSIKDNSTLLCIVVIGRYLVVVRALNKLLANLAICTSNRLTINLNHCSCRVGVDCQVLIYIALKIDIHLKVA